SKASRQQKALSITGNLSRLYRGSTATGRLSTSLAHVSVQQTETPRGESGSWAALYVSVVCVCRKGRDGWSWPQSIRTDNSEKVEMRREPCNAISLSILRGGSCLVPRR